MSTYPEQFVATSLSGFAWVGFCGSLPAAAEGKEAWGSQSPRVSCPHYLSLRQGSPARGCAPGLRVYKPIRVNSLWYPLEHLRRGERTPSWNAFCREFVRTRFWHVGLSKQRIVSTRKVRRTHAATHSP